MEYNFEEFEQGPVEANGKKVYVTLNRRGNFFLNRYAMEEMGSPQAVVLMFDKRQKVIGIARSSASKPNAFVLKRKERQRPTGGRVLYAANFCRHHSIKTSKTLSFTNATVKDGLLILDLHNVVKVGK